MRIRKRFLSLSAAATTTPPPPSSDLHAGDHHHQPLIVVQHHQQQQQLLPHKINPYPHDDEDDTRLSKFSDPSHRPSPPSSALETSQIGLQQSPTHLHKTKEHLESEKKMKDIIKTDESCRKESFLCAEANSHDLVLKGWLEGDMMIPVKKRRGSIGKKVNRDFQEDNEIGEGITESISRKNKNNEKKGNVIMEGSRCSRVNGRGWRCGQQTLVGYSLCEHHLGKGRLRSMTTNNVRGRALKEQEPKKKKDKGLEIRSLENHETEDGENNDEDEDEFKDWEMKSVSSSIKGTEKFRKKKKKVGVVKARSLSSLLGQIDK